MQNKNEKNSNISEKILFIEGSFFDSAKNEAINFADCYKTNLQEEQQLELTRQQKND
jgi:hypothetical protein